MPIGLILTTVLMLLVGAFAHVPYDFYAILRIVALITFTVAASAADKRNHETLMWIFIVAAFIFNPFIQLHLAKEAWMVIDVAAAVLLLGSIELICDSTEDTPSTNDTNSNTEDK